MLQKRTLVAFMSIAGVAALVPHHARANSCDAPKQISVSRACGKVLALNFDGDPIPNVELGLLSNTGQTIASTTTDAKGNFDLSGIHPGTYSLYTKSKTWDTIRWPVKVSQAKGSGCSHPLYVVLAPKSGMGCLSWVTKNKRASK